MKNRHAFASVFWVLCVLIGLSKPAHGAEWYKLGSVSFPERRAVTVTNPTDVAVNGFPVRIQLNDLQVAEDARGTAVIVDADGKPSREGEAGGVLLPHQVNNNVLSFSVSLKPSEKKTYYLYTTKQEIKGISFPPQTSADIREAYRSFENNRVAFRVEIGKAAKTTGLTVDLFGKTKLGQSKGAILKQIYASHYHDLQPWGIDVLKVGHSPGLGGVYVVDGEKMARTNAETTEFKVLEGEQGPVLTRVHVHGPVEINGKKLDVGRTMTLTADDRGIRDVVEVKGDAAAVKDLKIGIGIRNLPKETWNEDAKAGYAFVDGAGNQKGTEHMGLGFAFLPDRYVRTEVIKPPATATAPATAAAKAPTTEPEVEDGGRIVVLTPDVKEGTVTSKHHLTGYWNGDGEINTKEAFQKLLADWSKSLANPPKVELGKPEHVP